MKTLYSIAILAGLLLAPIAGLSQIYQGSTTVSSPNNMSVEVTVNTNTNLVEIEMTGTNGSWFAYGFGGGIMSNTYSIIVNGAGTVQERLLGNHTQGSALASTTTIVSNTVNAGVRTVVLTRARVGASGSYFTFPNSASNYSIIWARGSAMNLNQHPSGGRGASVIQMMDVCNFPTTVLPDVTACAGDSALVFGNWENQAGTYTSVLTTSLGCDSIIEQDLVIANPTTQTLPVLTVCDGDSIDIFGEFVSTAGNYFDTLQTSVGCDSVLEQPLFVEAQLTGNIVINGTSLDASSFGATSYLWINCSDSSSTGIIDSVFSPSTAGEYAVIVMGTTCIDTSDCVFFQPQSIEENSIFGSIILQPNPVVAQLTVVQLPDETNWKVIDLNGRIITSGIHSSEALNIRTNEWSSGMYILQLEKDQSVGQFKFVKQ